jgi:hypothetical protein
VNQNGAGIKRMKFDDSILNFWANNIEERSRKARFPIQERGGRGSIENCGVSPYNIINKAM